MWSRALEGGGQAFPTRRALFEKPKIALCAHVHMHIWKHVHGYMVPAPWQPHAQICRAGG